MKPTDPRLPLGSDKYERLAQNIVAGKNAQDEPMSKREAYLAAGYHPKDRATASSACSALLSRRSNGIRARVDFLRDQVTQKLVRQEIKLQERHLQKTEMRQEEVGGMLDHLWKLATHMRPKVNSSGASVLGADGEIIMEPASFSCATKIAELMGIDAGMFVRQSRSGAIQDDWNNLTDEALLAMFKAEMEKYGYDVVPRGDAGGDATTESGEKRKSGTVSAIR